ncbi:hypothetical protein LSTR_LSTR007311 [Laodelphax striatellus]|uniref:F-box domain-containing protein n=1 Tax=Laodelphax striatellus TaxID=195883 RepID=A0A482WT03_LAOST|nr:hypothetical protein LSTR_LSTR007311 [Laodelphax striatellus]
MSLASSTLCLDRLFDENEGYERSQQACNRDRVDFVTMLPVEATEAIFSYLSVRDLRSCSAVSIGWHEMSNSCYLWRKIAEDAHLRRSGVANQPLDKDLLTSVESNFLNELKRFRVPADSVRLSPMNDWKRFHCQCNFLLYNWERGFFAAHVHTFPKLVYSSHPRRNTTRVTFPSTLPKDRLFLPYQYRSDSVASVFYLLRLDDAPKVACELDVGVVPIACVNRDCFVFVHKKKVELLKLDENNSTSYKIKTVGELFTDCSGKEECDKGENDFLNMDDEVIVAGFKYMCIKVWCKATLTLRKTFNLQFNGRYRSHFSYCHFHDSTLYFSTWTNHVDHVRPEAELKIWELKVAGVKRIVMNREGTKVCSNERYFLKVKKLNVNSNAIEVRERDDYNMVTMTGEQDNSENWGIAVPVVLLCGERVLYLEAS